MQWKGVGVHPSFPHKPGLILPSWWTVRQKAAVATTCTLCLHPWWPGAQSTQSCNRCFLAYIQWWGLNWPWLVRVGGARPPPFTTFTLTSKFAVYAPAEWADTLTLFHLYQYMYSVTWRYFRWFWLGWPAANREVGNPRIGIRIGFFHQTAKSTKSTFKKAPHEELWRRSKSILTFKNIKILRYFRQKQYLLIKTSQNPAFFSLINSTEVPRTF
jgi:hypothetical protein